MAPVAPLKLTVTLSVVIDTLAGVLEFAGSKKQFVLTLRLVIL